MCGICGLVGMDQTVRPEPAALERMNNAMAHRGPDDAGVWINRHVALAMRRLSILDLPGGRQPMFNEDGSIVVVFNGEIYNFEELRSELEKRGRRFRTRSDTEVIVHAYESLGDACLDRFNGMYAFALFDRKQDRLLLARDRLGIKPVFYAIRDGTLLFASELDALMRSGLIKKELYPRALRDYFSFLYIPAPDTIYRDVRKLCPGEKLVLHNGTVIRERYWRPEYKINPTWTLDAAAERFLELARDAVRLQCISDVPLGAFLSGGLDSSTVVALMAHAGAEPVKTFTIGFDDAGADELDYARRVARHFHTVHTEEVMHPDLTATIPELLRHFGEPFADSSAIPTWLVSKLARRKVTVALSGDGGDELFAGYTWMRMNRHVARAARLPATAKRAFRAVAQWLPDSPAGAKVRRLALQMEMDPRESFRLRETCFTAPMLDALLRPEWRDRQDECPDRWEEHAAEGPHDLPNWMLHQDTVMYLPDDILTKVDRMSMANSIEARVPLLDHRLVEFAATVPFPLKYRGGVSKRLVKHALRDLLPPEILKQRKQGFSMPIQRWFRKELRDYFHETVIAGRAKSNEYLNPEYVNNLYDRHAGGREDYGHHLWAVLVFEHWLASVR